MLKNFNFRPDDLNNDVTIFHKQFSPPKKNNKIFLSRNSLFEFKIVSSLCHLHTTLIVELISFLSHREQFFLLSAISFGRCHHCRVYNLVIFFDQINAKKNVFETVARFTDFDCLYLVWYFGIRICWPWYSNRNWDFFFILSKVTNGKKSLWAQCELLGGWIQRKVAIFCGLFKHVAIQCLKC